MTPAAVAIVAAAAGYAGYLTWISVEIVHFPGYSRTQRFSQLALVWLLPIVGALAVHMVMYGFTVKARRRDDHFTPEDNAMS